MNRSKFTRQMIVATLSCSLFLTACDGFQSTKSGRDRSAAAKAKATRQAMGELTASNSQEARLEDIKAKLPTFANGYTDELLETFVDYIVNEANNTTLMAQIEKLDADQFTVARLKMQQVLKEMKAAKLIGEKEETRIRVLSGLMNDMVASKSALEKESEFAIYGTAAVIGAVIGGMGEARAILASVRAGISRISERTPVVQIRNGYKKWQNKKWLDKNPAEFVRPATKPMVALAQIDNAVAAASKNDQGFFINVLGQATGTNTSLLRNVEAQTLKNEQVAKEFLEVTELEWMPTHISGVNQANTGKKLVYSIKTSSDTVLVGFRDLVQDTTRLDRGNENTRQLSNLLMLKKSKEKRLNELAALYTETSKAMNVSSNNRVFRADPTIMNRDANKNKLAQISEEMKTIGEKWLGGRIDRHITEQALRSAEARYAGKVELREHLRTQYARHLKSSSKQEKDVLERMVQGPARKEDERLAEAEKIIGKLKADEVALKKRLDSLDSDIALMDGLSATIRARAAAKAELSTVNAASPAAKTIQAKVADLETQVKTQMDRVILREKEQAHAASAHLENQPFATTLAKSGQFGNEAVSVVIPGRANPVATGLNYEQFSGNFPALAEKSGPRLVDPQHAFYRSNGANAVAGGVLGFIALGGGIDLIAIEDGWEDVSAEQLDAFINTLPAPDATKAPAPEAKKAS